MSVAIVRPPSTRPFASIAGSVLSDCTAAVSGNEASILSGERNSMGRKRGVPLSSVDTLTMPTAAASAKPGIGNRKSAASGTPASGSAGSPPTRCRPAAKDAAPAITLGPLRNAATSAASPAGSPLSRRSMSMAMTRGSSARRASTRRASSARGIG